MRLPRQFYRDIAAARQAAGDIEGAKRMRKMAELKMAWYFCRRCGHRHRVPIMDDKYIGSPPCRDKRW